MGDEDFSVDVELDDIDATLQISPVERQKIIDEAFADPK